MSFVTMLGNPRHGSPEAPHSCRYPVPTSSDFWNGSIPSTFVVGHAGLIEADLKSQILTPRSFPSVSVPANAKVLLLDAPCTRQRHIPILIMASADPLCDKRTNWPTQRDREPAACH